MAKTLYAVDVLSGFVTAYVLVRPEGLKAKSVRKKMKQNKSPSSRA